VTTPGHQASQNAADGHLPSGTGFPQGDDGAPEDDGPPAAPAAGRHGRHAAAPGDSGPDPAADSYPQYPGQPGDGYPGPVDGYSAPAGDWGPQVSAHPGSYPPATGSRVEQPGADPAGYAPPVDNRTLRLSPRGRRGHPGPADGRPQTPPAPPADQGWQGWVPDPGGAWDPPTVQLFPVAWAPNTSPPPRTPASPGAGPPAAKAPGPAGGGMLRSSSTMALGTIASRGTGFVRSFILVYALGVGLLGSAYNLSNTLPNVVYQFALGGIFTSVVVPLLVKAATRDSDRGEGYDQRIFTLGVLALAAVTLVALAATAPITALYAGSIHKYPAAYHLTEVLAFFFIPQIFFYGVSSLAGAILNARGSFASPMWTPVINNIVVIAVGIMFVVVAGLNRTPGQLNGSEVALLGIGTTAGIVLQTVAMIPSLHRVGFRWRPTFDFRRAEISEMGRMSGWMFGYVLTTQVAFLITTRVAGTGFAAYSNAYLLFQLPYAVVGISVITAMLPRMSSHASEGRYQQVASDFSAATRIASVIVVPAALILAVVGVPLAQGIFGHGSTSQASARYVGEIFAVFSLGLLPYMLFQLLLRVFYAMHDSRTPALIGAVTMAVNITTNLIAVAVLPPSEVVVGLGACFGIANIIGTTMAWRTIGRRIGGLNGIAVRKSLARMHLAALPGAVFALAIMVMVGAIIPGGTLAALTTVVIGGAGALLLYVTFAKAIGVPELDDLIGTVRSRLR
jgi:putative peptidoglycan lipid II flippase